MESDFLPPELSNVGIPFDEKPKQTKVSKIPICELCGKPMKLKTVFKGRTFHRRKFQSYECIDCGSAVYKHNDREEAILKDRLDNEL